MSFHFEEKVGLKEAANSIEEKKVKWAYLQPCTSLTYHTYVFALTNTQFTSYTKERFANLSNRQTPIYIQKSQVSAATI